jgi:transcriptional regulator with XRE-family HTH domain
MPAIKTIANNVLAKRLRQARESAGIPQDKLGVLIGLDEGCASARISRYESGKHQPPLKTVQLLAKKLNVSTAFLFCEDDLMADVILKLGRLSKSELAIQAKAISQLL